MRHSSLDLNAGWCFNYLNIFTLHHRHLASSQNRQVAEVMRVFQDGCACRKCGLFGIQTIAKVVSNHALSNIFDVNRAAGAARSI